MAQTYDIPGMSDPRELSRRAAQTFPKVGDVPHSHELSSIREIEYKKHQIRIETTYRITVDDVPVTGHLEVANDGSVHYHAIPNQEFASAVDMVKRVIDLTPPTALPGGGHHDQDHGTHGHEH
jgi:hypothetical protein